MYKNRPWVACMYLVHNHYILNLPWSSMFETVAYVCISATALQGKLKWQKKISSRLRGCSENTLIQAFKTSPHLIIWILNPQTLLLPSLSADPIQRLAIKGFRDWGSPGWGHSRGSLEINWVFFCHFNFPWSAVFFIACSSFSSIHVTNAFNKLCKL